MNIANITKSTRVSNKTIDTQSFQNLNFTFEDCLEEYHKSFDYKSSLDEDEVRCVDMIYDNQDQVMTAMASLATSEYQSRLQSEAQSKV